MNAVHESAVDIVIARVKAVYGRWGRQTSVAQMRADWDALFRDPARPATMDVCANGVPCRWVDAAGVRADRVIVYFHGGGFQVGSLDSHGELMARLAAASGARVLGVAYRLAPEHRFPAPLDDARCVVDWLESQGFAASRIALAGDSAGGGLVLSTLLALAAEKRPLPVAAYVMSAWTDLTASGASYDTCSALDPINQRPMILAMARNYLGKEGAATDPRASPLMASSARLAALPPLLLQVGERETVASDSELFADRLRAAGGNVELQVWPGMIHVFQQFPAELVEAREAIVQGGRFLARHFDSEILRKNAP